MSIRKLPNVVSYVQDAEEYYDGTKLLSMKDINGATPEIFLCTTNRTGGKTTYFNRLAVNRYLNKGAKFALLYRFNYELDDCADKFFKDIKGLFFNNHNMDWKKRAKGVFGELFLDDKSCGYVLPLNSADQIKKNSHLLSDTNAMYFDEFQSETGQYCEKEVQKFISIHTSLARGNGEQVKYLPVYMIGNPITMLNPYYVELGICNRLTDKTRFLRGDGWVLEQGYVESAGEAQKTSAFNRAFASNKYVAYSAQSVYLNDNLTFIEKPSGNSRYLATLRYDGCDYSIREYAETGIVYCSDKADSTFPLKIVVTTEDHQKNYVMLKNNDFFLGRLRYFFEHGCFRFKSIKCKEAVLNALSY